MQWAGRICISIPGEYREECVNFAELPRSQMRILPAAVDPPAPPPRLHRLPRWRPPLPALPTADPPIPCHSPRRRHPVVPGVVVALALEGVEEAAPPPFRQAVLRLLLHLRSRPPPTTLRKVALAVAVAALGSGHRSAKSHRVIRWQLVAFGGGRRATLWRLFGGIQRTHLSVAVR